jgi:hypothetical protein
VKKQQSAWPSPNARNWLSFLAQYHLHASSKTSAKTRAGVSQGAGVGCIFPMATDTPQIASKAILLPFDAPPRTTADTKPRIGRESG